MTDLFTYLGDSAFDYRGIMFDHTDFNVPGRLIPKAQVVIAEQTHSDHICLCSTADGGAGFDDHPQIADCDALITNVKNLFLLIRTADCTPILFYDKPSGCIGAVHSGREGTRKNIAGKTVSALQKAYGAQPENIRALIGPGICAKHYQVSDAIWHDFAQSCRNNGFRIIDSELPYIAIKDMIMQQLIAAGIKPEQIQTSDCCTYESASHFSFRKNGTHNRQINLIGMVHGKHHL